MGGKGIRMKVRCKIGQPPDGTLVKSLSGIHLMCLSVHAGEDEFDYIFAR